MQSNLHSDPSSTPPTPLVSVQEFKQIEELKHVVKERRFVVSNYMQALALYITLAGFGLSKLSEAKPLPLIWLMGCLFTLLNGLAIYAAGHYKSMWQYADKRERELAIQLQMSPPHSLIWGYVGGVTVVLIGQVTVIVLVVLQQLGKIQPPEYIVPLH